MKSFIITSTKKSSGKTIVSIGLSALLKAQKKSFSVFKKGPDYIDPIWLSKASGKDCFNLDFFTMQKKEIISTFNKYSKNCDLAVVEGNKGLFDGLSLDGSDSNASLAELLNLRVILVIDCNGMTRGIAPLINGYKSFNKKIKYQGVILNNVNGDRHQSKLVASIEKYTDFKIIGSIWRDSSLSIQEQHLGLVPSFAHKQTVQKIRGIRDVMKKSVDIDMFNNKVNKKKISARIITKKKYAGLKIGIMRDEAFGFYYKDDLEKFTSLGSKLVRIDSVNDKKLPKIDALLIGGGFPELCAYKLSKNKSMLNSVNEFIESHYPVYAECGGLMYLTKKIKYNSKIYPMVGVINGETQMFSKPVGRGYVMLETSVDHPWLANSLPINCHEFHHSKLRLKESKYKYAYRVKRGYGIDGKHEGLIYKNLLATYNHLRDTKQTNWVDKFLSFVDKQI